MRITGWLLLIAGVLLCVSIVWAPIGFLFMGLGLICLQIAERKNARLNKFVVLPSEESDLQPEPPPLQEVFQAVQESSQAVVISAVRDGPEYGHNGNNRVSAVGQASYDKEKWRILVKNDAELSRLEKILESYGQKYVDELAAAYLVLKNKEYLPMILRKIIESARRNSAQNITSERLQRSNADAVKATLGNMRRTDGARDLLPDHTDDPVNNVAEVVSAGLKKVWVSESFRRSLGGSEIAIIEEAIRELAAVVAEGRNDLNRGRHSVVQVMNLNPAARATSAASDDEPNLNPIAQAPTDVGDARKTGIEGTIRPVPTVADAAGKGDATRQKAADATSAKPQEMSVTPGGGEEKSGARKVDAVDDDNLTDILRRIAKTC